MKNKDINIDKSLIKKSSTKSFTFDTQINSEELRLKFN